LKNLLLFTKALSQSRYIPPGARNRRKHNWRCANNFIIRVAAGNFSVPPP